MRLGTVATSMRPDPLLLQCASSYVGAMVLDPRRMKIGLHCLGCAPLWSDPRRLMSSSSAAPCVTSATFKLQRAPDYDMVLALQLPGPVPHEARKWRSALIRLVQDALMILYVSPHDHFVRYMLVIWLHVKCPPVKDQLTRVDTIGNRRSLPTASIKSVYGTVSTASRLDY